MAEDFHLEDVLEELNSLPDFLHRSKEAERWLCQVIANVRQKNCGREEIAFLFGFPVSALNEALPSSADPVLIGEMLTDINFVPAGAGCMAEGCRSLAHLNGRKCTVCKDVTEEAGYALVIVDGCPGTEVEMGTTILIATKNLRFSCPPWEADGQGWPPLGLASLEAMAEAEAKLPCPTLPSSQEVLGPTPEVPEHLQSPEALSWIATVVGRLVVYKGCGREELCHLLAWPTTTFAWGSAVLPSVTEEHVGQLLDELKYLPEGLGCTMEGSNSFAHLNGKSGFLVRPCCDGQEHAAISGLDAEEMLVHRKNLRLTALVGQVSPTIVNAPTGAAAFAADLPISAPPAAQAEEISRSAVAALKAGEPMSSQESSGQASSFAWLFGCCASTTAMKPERMPMSNAGGQPMVPVSAPAAVAPVPFAPANASTVADELGKLAALKAGGVLTDAEFDAAKARVLAAG